MFARFTFALMALALVGCDQASSPTAGSAENPQLDSPAPESEPSRVFTSGNDAARTAAGAQVNVTMSLRLPDANQPSADQQEVLTLRAANGLIIDAAINGAVSPATMVEGQTLRALLALPVEEPQVLVYRVNSETKPESGQGLCGAGAAAFVVVWEPSGPGEAVMKVMGVSGGAPGAAGAHPCPMLEFRRS